MSKKKASNDQTAEPSSCGCGHDCGCQGHGQGACACEQQEHECQCGGCGCHAQPTPEELAAEYLEAAKRIKADFENYRRRNESARAEAMIDGQAQALAALLPILDTLERALVNAPKDDAFAQGIEMTVKQFGEALESLQVLPVDCLDKPFDPAMAMAVGQEMRPDVQAGTVTQVLQKGYTLQGKLLRPAMVLVQQ